MSRITVDAQSQIVFDDEDLVASYQAEFTPEGVSVRVEVRHGDVLLGTVPIALFRGDQINGFGEES